MRSCPFVPCPQFFCLFCESRSCFVEKDDRDSRFLTAASMLPSLVKDGSLTFTELEELNACSQSGDAIAIYEMICEHTDLSHGRAQDKLRIAYAGLSLTPQSSMVQVRKFLDQKWWLYQHHTLHDAARDGGREGIRAILEGLIQGPPIVAGEAATALATVDIMQLPAGGASSCRGSHARIVGAHSQC